jgi:hypothetical protein
MVVNEDRQVNEQKNGSLQGRNFVSNPIVQLIYKIYDADVVVKFYFGKFCLRYRYKHVQQKHNY